eukprot:gene5324-33709_t
MTCVNTSTVLPAAGHPEEAKPFDEQPAADAKLLDILRMSSPRLLDILRTPYDDQPEVDAKYSSAPPEEMVKPGQALAFQLH